MPLPMSINYLDASSREQTAVIRAKKDFGYKPDPDYYPTMKVVRCRDCKTVGVAEFPGGFNLKDGDRLMAGKPIQGVCFRCGKHTELIPLEPNLKAMEPGLLHFYRIQQALDAAVKRGERLGPSGMVWPLARVYGYGRSRGEGTVPGGEGPAGGIQAIGA